MKNQEFINQAIYSDAKFTSINIDSNKTVNIWTQFMYNTTEIDKNNNNVTFYSQSNGYVYNSSN